IYKATSARFPDPSTQRRLAARAAEVGKRWPEFPVRRTSAVLAALIERIEVSVDQIKIRLRPRRLNALLDIAAAPIQGVIDDETEIVSVPIRLRRAGREIRMVIDGTDPFAVSKPDARLIKLLLKARRFNATLVGSDEVPFAALAERVLEQLLCCQIAARLARSADRAGLCLNPIRTQKPPVSFGCPHHRRCGTGIWPDRDITVRRPDVAASCTSLPTAPLAPART